MSKKFSFLIISLIFLFAILPLVSSAPPITTQSISTGQTMTIESPLYENLKIGQDHRFHAHVINQTRTLTNTTVSCLLHFYGLDGYDVDIGSQFMEFEGYNGVDFAKTVGAGNFTTAGHYSYVIQCNSTNEVAFFTGTLDVTPTGESLEVGRAIVDIGLLLLLALFIVGCVVIFMESENLLARVGTLGLGYLLLMAMSFISWNLSKDYLFSAPFLIEMFRIIFFVMIIGFFPLIIGLFAWYVLMLFKIKEIERLMGKGFSEQDAQRRVNHK